MIYFSYGISYINCVFNFPGIYKFVNYCKTTLPKLDIIINNAAQTIRRPIDFYRHLLDYEQIPIQQLPEPQQCLLANTANLNMSIKAGPSCSDTSSNVTDTTRTSSPSNTKLGNQHTHLVSNDDSSPNCDNVKQPSKASKASESESEMLVNADNNSEVSVTDLSAQTSHLKAPTLSTASSDSHHTKDSSKPLVEFPDETEQEADNVKDNQKSCPSKLLNLSQSTQPKPSKNYEQSKSALSVSSPVGSNQPMVSSPTPGTSDNIVSRPAPSISAQALSMMMPEHLREAAFPSGRFDADGQQLDLRRTNTWRYILAL